MPPLVGVAVNVTELPVHIEVLLAAIATDGTTEFVEIVIALLVAVSGLAHGALLVMITVTTSPFESVLLVNVADVCPGTFTPLICHW